MKEYDPNKALLSLHIPKCAGSSLRKMLRSWFGTNFFPHYYQQRQANPPKYQLKPGICIHGHFNHIRGFGVTDYYPAVDQYVTFLRDPLEMAISNYFFWKRKARARQIKLGKLIPGSSSDYRHIEDFFIDRPGSHLLNFLPPGLTEDNYIEKLESRFVYMGIVEDMKTSTVKLAEKLGFPVIDSPKVNVSSRDEMITAVTREKFISRSGLEYKIYQFARERYAL